MQTDNSLLLFAGFGNAKRVQPIADGHKTSVIEQPVVWDILQQWLQLSGSIL